MLKIILKQIKKLRCTSGNVAIMFAIIGPAAIMASGVALDFAQASSKSTNLQRIADAAALASAHELPLANSKVSVIKAVAENYIKANVGNNGSTFTSTVTVSKDFTKVSVSLSEAWKPTFAQFFSDKVTPITSNATARIFGSQSVCVVGLMPSKLEGVHLENNSKLTAEDCGIYSNSTSFSSIRLDGQSNLTAKMICSMGGTVKLFGARVSPKPITDCPKIQDPLESRPAPVFSGCDYQNYQLGEIAPVADIKNTNLVTSIFGSFKKPDLFVAKQPVGAFKRTTLLPGVYCGGLQIGKDQEVLFEPGVYVIKDGPLRLTDNARMSGTDVGFFLTGNASRFEFQADTRVSLEAPKEGPLAGLLFYEDRNVTYSFDFNPLDLASLKNSKTVRLHRIQSNEARKLLGTIYLPRSVLMIDANAPVADESAFTAVVVGRLWLRDGPNLVLNANYSATDVPLPQSLAGGEIALTR